MSWHNKDWNQVINWLILRYYSRIFLLFKAAQCTKHDPWFVCEKFAFPLKPTLLANAPICVWKVKIRNLFLNLHFPLKETLLTCAPIYVWKVKIRNLFINLHFLWKKPVLSKSLLIIMKTLWVYFFELHWKYKLIWSYDD